MPTESAPKAPEADNTEYVGERIAEFRAMRRMRVGELARQVGVTGSLISQIERGRARPSISTLFLIGEALEVPMDAFFKPAGTPTPVYTGAPASLSAPPTARATPTPAPRRRAGARDRFLVRDGERATIEIAGGVRWERLTPDNLDEGEFLEAVYGPGSESSSELYRHPGSEWVYVLEGSLEITVGFTLYRLEPRDSLWFPSSIPHRYANPTDRPARIISVNMWDRVAEPHGDGATDGADAEPSPDAA